MLSAERIEKNYKTFRALCAKLGDRAEHVTKMLDHFDVRLAMAPASSRKQYHAAYPGGLVEHSLHVFSNARRIAESYDIEIPVESLIIGCLFHDLGKVGSLEADLYVAQDEQWRADKNGEVYKINKEIQWMPTSERGLWILQHFGVKLTEDEWLAIRLNDGMYVEENRTYAMREPALALIVHQADRLSTLLEKSE